MWPIVIRGMAVGIALAMPIGPINVEIVRRGLEGGFRRGWLVGLGAVTADTLYCVVVVTGLAPVADRPALRAPLFLAGAVVLLYLGITGITAKRQGSDPVSRPPTSRRSYWTGFIMAAANPLGIVYWLSIGAALIASAVEGSGEAATPFLVGGVFAGIVLWVTILSTLAQAGRRFVSVSVLRMATRLAALVLVGFGVYFGYEGLSAIFAT